MFPRLRGFEAYVVGLCQADQILPRFGTRSCGHDGTGFLSAPPLILINIHISPDSLSDFDMSSVHNHPGCFHLLEGSCRTQLTLLTWA